MNDELISEFEHNLAAESAVEELTCLGDEECCLDNEPADFRSDAEADADVLASAGMGTDEDYAHYLFDETPMGEQYGGE